MISGSDGSWADELGVVGPLGEAWERGRLGGCRVYLCGTLAISGRKADEERIGYQTIVNVARIHA